MTIRTCNHIVRGFGAVIAVLLSAAVILPAHAQSAESTVNGNKAQISLADARSRIDQAIATPSVMTAIMQHLCSDDQKQFLADVNKAIADMPASTEEKAAKFLNVNHAALKGAADGNVVTLIAEVFATVTVEALTVINERFAIDLFSRSLDANSGYTDAQFLQVALEVMSKVNERCEGMDDESPRCVFAILMLVRASNGSPNDLSETLIDTLKDEGVRALARNVWIPSALGTGDQSQSYESILAAADAGRRPDFDFVLVIAGPQYGDAILADIITKTNSVFSNYRTPVLDAVENPLSGSATGIPLNPIDANADPVVVAPGIESAALLNLEAEIWYAYFSSLQLFFENREIYHPGDNHRMEWAEVCNWIVKKKIDVSDLAASHYKVASLLLGSGVLADTNKFAIGNFSLGDKISFKVFQDGNSVATNSIVSMIQVCNDLGGAGVSWTSSVSATGLVSKAEINAATGEITITPDNNVTQLFIRLNIPKD